MLLRLSQWARLRKVSVSTARKWVEDGRLYAERPADRVVLVDSIKGCPKRLTPWERRRKRRIVC